MNKNEGEVSGEKIFCEGHKIQKPYLCIQSDGHKGKCANIKHGKCKLLKEFRWIKK